MNVVKGLAMVALVFGILVGAGPGHAAVPAAEAWPSAEDYLKEWNAQKGSETGKFCDTFAARSMSNLMDRLGRLPKPGEICGAIVEDAQIHLPFLTATGEYGDLGFWTAIGKHLALAKHWDAVAEYEKGAAALVHDGIGRCSDCTNFVFRCSRTGASWLENNRGAQGLLSELDARMDYCGMAEGAIFGIGMGRNHVALGLIENLQKTDFTGLSTTSDKIEGTDVSFVVRKIDGNRLVLDTAKYKLLKVKVASFSGERKAEYLKALDKQNRVQAQLVAVTLMKNVRIFDLWNAFRNRTGSTAVKNFSGGVRVRDWAQSYMNGIMTKTFSIQFVLAGTTIKDSTDTSDTGYPFVDVK